MMKLPEFRQQILSLHERYPVQPTLEVYLRSLWKLLNERRNEGPSLRVFIEMLELSFTSAPAEFMEEWMSYENPADYSEMIYSEDETFKFLKDTILFQIADLRRMKGKQLDNEFKEMGITSPTGYSWYNFKPTIYLECGTALIDEINEESQDDAVSWIDLENILEIGRMYE